MTRRLRFVEAPRDRRGEPPMLTAEQVATISTPFEPSEPDSRGRRAYGGNRALGGAWRKGALAAIEGKPLDACPYYDHRTYRGGVTFSRAFERAWCEGWHFALYGGLCKLQPNHDGECEFDAVEA